MYEEITELDSHSAFGATIDLHCFITVVLERIELHNEYRALVFGSQRTSLSSTVKVDSKSCTQFNPAEVP